MKTLWLALAIATFVLISPCAAQERGATANSQDYVFLGEARPVLLRLHIRVDGQPVEKAWATTLDYLFNHLDVNSDGVLSREEAGRAPAASQLLGGGPSRGFGRLGQVPARPRLDALDADQDGNVTRAELAAYYRKNGYAPFRIQFDAGRGDPIAGAAAAFLGGQRPEPSVDEVGKAIFNLLDTDRDGKLTAAELAETPAALLRMDEDDDEIVTTRELAPNTRPVGNLYQIGGMMGRSQPPETDARASLLVPVSPPGVVPTELAARLRERYGSKENKTDAKTLSRQDLGVDEATFTRLDANRDAVLDGPELGGFVKRTPDLELIVRLGKAEAGAARVETVASATPASALAGKLQVKNGLALLDLGVTRLDIRAGEEARSSLTNFFLPKQNTPSFKQADTDGNGHLDESEITSNRRLRVSFKELDRDGDGKVTEKELTAHFTHERTLRERATGGCATLILADQSRGLFDLLDANRDGRLSVRELRQGPSLLSQLDAARKGYLTQADIPHRYQLTARRGPGNAGGNPAALIDLYLSGGQTAPKEATTAGPLWFRKMDRNRDGDVSRKEFLFSPEAFRKLDANGDGLLSAAEAAASGAD